LAAVSTAAAWGALTGDDEKLQSFLAAAQQAAARKDFSAAGDAYRRAAKLSPQTAELWANMGLMYHEAGRSGDAIQSFKEAKRLNASLYVPQLFLGIEYLQSQKPDVALPFLRSASRLNRADPQPELSLGKAYAMLNRGDRAAESYLKATEIAPNDGDAFIGLGTAYLQQVEYDARAMTLTYGHSPYATLRAAETFAEEGKLVQAETAFKTALAPPSSAPCAHAELGIILLRQKKVAEAREQFELEQKTSSHCGFVPLGLAVADLAQEQTEIGIKKIGSIVAVDPGFAQSSLPLFHDALSEEQVKTLVERIRAPEISESNPIDLSALVERAFSPDNAATSVDLDPPGTNPTAADGPKVDARILYSTGQYAACDRSLKAGLKTLASSQEHLLASCSFYIGDFSTTVQVAARLKANRSTAVEGLYWESKADQNLAINALSRAAEIDPDSPRMHVLIGDVFRQKRRWGQAEEEYRKAVALDPKSRSARLSLAIVLFTELKDDEALKIDNSLLAEQTADPEANLLAAEILVQEHEFERAEPFLSRCQGLRADLVPRLHVLFGQVDSAAGRTREAISEFKLGLASDGDGSIHYQLARLYQRTGDATAAAEEIRISKQLREHWDNLAHVAVEQLATDVSRQ